MASASAPSFRGVAGAGGSAGLAATLAVGGQGAGRSLAASASATLAHAPPPSASALSTASGAAASASSAARRHYLQQRAGENAQRKCGELLAAFEASRRSSDRANRLAAASQALGIDHSGRDSHMSAAAATPSAASAPRGAGLAAKDFRSRLQPGSASAARAKESLSAAPQRPWRAEGGFLAPGERPSGGPPPPPPLPRGVSQRPEPAAADEDFAALRRRLLARAAAESGQLSLEPDVPGANQHVPGSAASGRSAAVRGLPGADERARWRLQAPTAAEGSGAATAAGVGTAGLPPGSAASGRAASGSNNRWLRLNGGISAGSELRPGGDRFVGDRGGAESDGAAHFSVVPMGVGARTLWMRQEHAEDQKEHESRLHEARRALDWRRRELDAVLASINGDAVASPASNPSSPLSGLSVARERSGGRSASVGNGAGGGTSPTASLSAALGGAVGPGGSPRSAAVAPSASAARSAGAAAASGAPVSGAAAAFQRAADWAVRGPARLAVLRQEGVRLRQAAALLSPEGSDASPPSGAPRPDAAPAPADDGGGGYGAAAADDVVAAAAADADADAAAAAAVVADGGVAVLPSSAEALKSPGPAVASADQSSSRAPALATASGLAGGDSAASGAVRDPLAAGEEAKRKNNGWFSWGRRKAR
eukprot:TRINITY_DN39296_c0_g1_i1.p1 TRINITY_DN39296_c0_g1~~TRINITY_DN39296_c0_g1_i1.p1  ORF type:complete len:674 (-),score=162.84 TRINITY_DN39296_c0_g1_i1:39-2003(-)